MTDPIVNKAAEQVTQETAADSAKPKNSVSADDVSKFEEAMNPEQKPGVKSDQAAAATSTETTDPARASQAPESIGEAILETVEGMKTSQDARIKNIEEQLANVDGKEMTVEECMKLQFELMQLSMEQQMSGKIADKSSQGVQQLFKPQ